AHSTTAFHIVYIGEKFDHITLFYLVPYSLHLFFPLTIYDKYSTKYNVFLFFQVHIAVHIPVLHLFPAVSSLFLLTNSLIDCFFFLFFLVPNMMLHFFFFFLFHLFSFSFVHFLFKLIKTIIIFLIQFLFFFLY